MSILQQPIGADVEAASPVEEFMPTFYVGNHESRRPLPVTEFVLRQAQDVGVRFVAPPNQTPANVYSMICLPVL
jgi:protein arginine N-methyltransferase 5